MAAQPKSVRLGPLKFTRFHSAANSVQSRQAVSGEFNWLINLNAERMIQLNQPPFSDFFQAKTGYDHNRPCEIYSHDRTEV